MRSHSYKTRLSVLCPSVRPPAKHHHGPAMDAFSWRLNLETIRVRWENPNLITIGQESRAHYTKEYVLLLPTTCQQTHSLGEKLGTSRWYKTFHERATLYITSTMRVLLITPITTSTYFDHHASSSTGPSTTATFYTHKLLRLLQSFSSTGLLKGTARCFIVLPK